MLAASLLFIGLIIYMVNPVLLKSKLASNGKYSFIVFNGAIYVIPLEPDCKNLKSVYPLVQASLELIGYGKLVILCLFISIST